MKEVTYEDLFGETGAWYVIYPTALEFVRDELEEILKVHTTTPLHRLYTESDKFSMKMAGYYHEWAKKVADALSEAIWNNDSDAKKESVLAALIMILNDKQSFLVKLATAIGAEMDREEEDEEKEEEDSEQIDETAFQKIVAQIVLKVVDLYPLKQTDLLSADEKMSIETAKDDVLMQCHTLNMGAESQKVVSKFFGYFFNPSKGGCECGGEGSFFGNLFGKMCK